ncbi:MAG: MBL fold metallo-hydrolase [Candidatus Magasanikbacteria bacterium]|nr:MBL fold metallo-hydrolase [Candidatus Magasanikbacteria bacterium]
MNITFWGAAGEVTGSCHLWEGAGKKFLIDCGLWQGGEFLEDRNWREFPFAAGEIEAIILTHAHLDHVGRLPRLVKAGFNGWIYATPATRDLARLVLLDALEVMRYHQKKTGVPLLFNEKDIEAVCRLFKNADYEEKRRLASGAYFTLKEAGHILGSAFVKIEAEEKILVFSGDIGNSHVPIVRETADLGEVDFLVLEATYGHVNHEDPEKRIFLLQEAVGETVKRGGVLMIPAFSLERTQEILYEFNNLINNHLIPCVPIFLDSPLAAAATAVYKKYPKYFDEAARYLIGRGDDLFNFPGLKITRSVAESKAINEAPAPKIIVAGSGMMNGGRILHHAARYLGDSQSQLLIISYQAAGTLGRRLLQGAKEVKIYGEKIKVKAKIKAIGAYSAHGDQNKLTGWVKEAKRAPQKIFLVHGDPEGLEELKVKLEKETGIVVVKAEYGQKVVL